MMIQVQNFQSLLQAKIYSHFALRNSLFSAPRKVDKNTQRMVTNRYYSLTIDAEKVVSRRRLEQFERSETSNDTDFYTKISKSV